MPAGTRVAIGAGMVRHLDIALHLGRLALSGLGLAAGARFGCMPLVVVASGALFLGSFAFMHDVAHGALKLPRRWNEAALAFAGGLMLMSGHALRRMHLRHHARTMADDDLEGRPARGGLLGAIASGPCDALALRREAFRSAGASGKRWQAIETSVNVAALAALIASGIGALRVYALVAILAQLTMSAWASQVPHNAPPWLVRLAERLAIFGSPTMLSLAYHELHHEHPEVPCSRLGSVA